MPNALLGPLLEEISDVAEVKVVLRAFWLLHRKKGGLRTMALDEFLNDLSLLKALSTNGRDPRRKRSAGDWTWRWNGAFCCGTGPAGSRKDIF